MNEKFYPLLKKLKTVKKIFKKIICCDNAGENKNLKENCAKKQINLFLIYITRQSTAKLHGRTGILYTLFPDAHYDGSLGTT